ncbi:MULTISPECIES: hypothetical protein [unclassified Thermosipho (in: thermotogales)]|uniref:hypothetical protein n=1 Tax=unclassified Thermosipho (in: thermotogales) TaxID=2676525 RepID=UPI001E3EC309|nr:MULTISPECIES: hypothetical protein [unclassified Thermosipho (in: thermotogales)]
MKKMIIIFTFIFFVVAFGEVSAIRNKHKKGFFVEFSSIGYALEDSELSSQPLLDILGAFNFNYRHYLGENTVLNFTTYFIDPLFIGKVYMQEEVNSNEQVYFSYSENYIFSNFFFKDFSFKTYFNIVLPGLITNQGYVFALVPKGFVGIGRYIMDNTEIFGTVECGTIFNIFTSNPDEEMDEYVRRLRDDSFYSTLKLGLNWYYDNYSGIEIGYRFLLYGKSGYLSFLQGVSFTDWVYNIVSLYYQSNNQETIMIPFITTDYYLTFSTKF